MSAQHTPGPWGLDDGRHIVDSECTEIARLIGMPHSKNQLSNGHLIAAAPELLAALRIALRAPGIHTTDQETGEVFSDVINAAITKAEGDQS